jgi:transcriptional regulator with XRE-family HTH domain
MTTAIDAIRKELADPEARHDYTEIFLNSLIAIQIKTLRVQRGWSQEDLAKACGMMQQRICTLEQASYRGRSLKTLLRLAKAFDLALVVRFESFGTFLKEVISLEQAALERWPFADDPEFKGAGALLAAVEAPKITPRSAVQFYDFPSRSRVQESPGPLAAFQNTKTINRTVGDQRLGLG